MNAIDPSPSCRETSSKISFPRRVWKRLKDRRFLFLSILAHVVFAIVAISLVVQTFAPKPPPTRGRSAPVSQPSAPKVRPAPANAANALPAAAPSKRILVDAMSNVALPEALIQPAQDAAVSPLMSGITSATLGGPAGKPGAPNGVQVPFFGVPDSTQGLQGRFYDFKRDERNRLTGMDLGKYGALLKQFTNGGWTIPVRYKFRESEVTLYSKFFFFPAIKDTEAGSAFHAPESGAGLWIAHYKGSLTAPEDGTYRLVGFGDNVMIVRIGGTLALDASDHGYTGRRREAAGAVKFAGKNGGTPVFFGTWITLRKGEVRPIEVLVGDEGGIYCAGLFVQKQGQSYQQDRKGIPRLPLLFVGAPTAEQKAALSKYLPSESLEGPYFSPAAGLGLPGVTR
jgi:hypothetical protein